MHVYFISLFLGKIKYRNLDEDIDEKVNFMHNDKVVLNGRKLQFANRFQNSLIGQILITNKFEKSMGLGLLRGVNTIIRPIFDHY